MSSAAAKLKMQSEGAGDAPTKVRSVPNRGRRYSAAFKRKCLDELAAGKLKAAIEQAKGVSGVTLLRWEIAAQKDKGVRAINGDVRDKNSDVSAKEAEVTGPDDPSADKEDGGAGSRAPHDNIAGLSDVEIDEILKHKRQTPSMGPAQIRAQLKRFRGWRISPKAIARVLKAHGYRSEHRGAREEQALTRFEAPHPNALWMMDALQLRVHAERLYLHLALDDFSRFIVGHRLGEQINSEEAVATLKEAIDRHGKPERVLTDRGGQFLALRKETAFRRYLEQQLIDHSVSRPYHPQTLGKVESVNRAIQKELIYLREFGSVEEARAAIDAWVQHYNFRRAHLGIDGLTPADRYFGLHQRVLAEVQARSRGRATAAALDANPGSPIEDIGGVMEVLRLVAKDGRLELRFCGLAAELPTSRG